MAERWALTFKNLLFPIFCRECGCALLTENNGYFCPGCWELPERITRPFCTVCGRPQKDRVGFGPVENFPCADCNTAQDTPYRNIFGAVVYEGAVAEAIKLLKFYERSTIAGPLVALMAGFAAREIDSAQYDDIVPVPLHRVRRRSRGFNQAELLAEGLRDAFPQARLNQTLRRIRPTRIQSRIKDPMERRENVIGAFAVDTDANFDGRTVLLIDDVVTTGGTVSECARALTRAGAAEVDVLAVALPSDEPDRLPHEHRLEYRKLARAGLLTR